ncbi:MAG: beta/gamma crystallin-related protein [Waterburya sp.]
MPKSNNQYAAINDGLYNIGTSDGNEGGGDNGFNDQVSSVNILRGEWVFYKNENFNAKFIAVNNGRTWKFYEETNFQGDFIEVEPDEARNIGDFGMEISSLKAL